MPKSPRLEILEGEKAIKRPGEGTMVDTQEYVVISTLYAGSRAPLSKAVLNNCIFPFIYFIRDIFDDQYSLSIY
jgi:hypothetical protein